MYDEGAVETMENVKTKKRLIFFYIVAIIVAIITVINMGILISLKKKTVGQNTQDVETSLKLQKQLHQYQMKTFEECIECSKFEVVKTDYSAYIKGMIKNSSDKDLFNIQMMFKCYDVFGDYIGTDIVYVNYLPAETTYNVDGYVSFENVNSVQLLTSTAYYADEIM